MKKQIVGIIVAVLLSVPAAAQEKPAVDAKAPVLTLEQKQALQLAAKDIEIAQLRAQAAAADFNAARERVNKLVAAYVPAGYQLTEQLELVKQAETPKVDKKDPPK